MSLSDKEKFFVVNKYTDETAYLSTEDYGEGDTPVFLKEDVKEAVRELKEAVKELTKQHVSGMVEIDPIKMRVISTKVRNQEDIKVKELMKKIDGVFGEKLI